MNQNQNNPFPKAANQKNKNGKQNEACIKPYRFTQAGQIVWVGRKPATKTAAPV